jgi:hypothetical protein
MMKGSILPALAACGWAEPTAQAAAVFSGSSRVKVDDRQNYNDAL